MSVLAVILLAWVGTLALLFILVLAAQDSDDADDAFDTLPDGAVPDESSPLLDRIICERIWKASKR